MKLTSAVLLLILGYFSFAGSAKAGSTEILPGVTYYDGSEELTGKLVFLLRHDYTIETNSESAASIYEFDLQGKKLRKISDAPAGLFLAARDGKAFCVIYWLGSWGIGKNTNIFAYSKSLELSRIAKVESSPQATVVVNDHIFVRLEGYDFSRLDSEYYQTTNHSEVASKIMDFDVAKNQVREIGFSDVSQWQYQEYNNMFVPHGRSDIFCFNYKGYGKRVGEGKDYPQGLHGLDIKTGIISANPILTADEYDEAFTWKSSDGRFVFFEGREGSGAPIEGFKLVSSPWNDFETLFVGAKEHDLKQVKVLHKFSILGAILNSHTQYMLHLMSPDGHYVLVSVTNPLNNKKYSEWPGSTTTYYLVDATTGKTRVLFEDRTEATTRSSIFNGYIEWVQSEDKP